MKITHRVSKMIMKIRFNKFKFINKLNSQKFLDGRLEFRA